MPFDASIRRGLSDLPERYFLDLLNNGGCLEVIEVVRAIAEDLDSAKFMELLTPCLCAEDEVRSLAIGILGMVTRKVEQPEDLMNLLKPLLKKDSSDVLEAVIEILQKLERKVNPDVLMNLLRPWLNDCNSNIRYAAIRTLGWIARQVDSGELRRLLIPMEKDLREGVCDIAKGILRMLEEKKAEAGVLMDLLKPALEYGDEYVCLRALLALRARVEKVGPGNVDLAKLMDLLEPLLKDGRKVVLEIATDILVMLIETADPAKLMKLLKSSLNSSFDVYSIRSRRAAIKGLGKLAGRVNLVELMNLLTPLLVQRDQCARSEASHAIVVSLAAREDPVVIMDLLRPQKEDGYYNYLFAREEMIWVLRGLEEEVDLSKVGSLSRLMNLLKNWLRDDLCWFARYAAIEVLSKRLIERANPVELMNLLSPLLEDTNENVRIAAIGGLGGLVGKVDSAALMGLLIPLLKDTNENVRIAATGVLEKLIKESDPDPDPDVLMNALREWLIPPCPNSGACKAAIETLVFWVRVRGKKVDLEKLMQLLRPLQPRQTRHSCSDVACAAINELEAMKKRRGGLFFKQGGADQRGVVDQSGYTKMRPRDGLR